jgi:lipopolysaccharide/colanic/teichoic acid biosynthesis glycosyltransferase
MFRDIVEGSEKDAVSYQLIAAPRRVGVQAVVKRLMDIVISASALVLFAPVLAALFLVVKRDGGPALYRQRRVGRGGKIFRCYKVRSMVMDSDRILQEVLEKDPEARREFETFWKLSKDPRITPFGAFMRRYSFDELPQFYNVLRGDMSIVGPRPRSETEIHRTNFIVTGIDPYLSVRPGLTGLWQISGRNNIDLEGKVQLDATYIQTWSIRKDIAIILSTFRVVFLADGAS